jgi:hypothetical protein
MVPVRPGGHIKTDPRDATTLAALYRASDRLSRPIHSAENNRRSQPQKKSLLCTAGRGGRSGQPSM